MKKILLKKDFLLNKIEELKRDSLKTKANKIVWWMKMNNIKMGFYERIFYNFNTTYNYVNRK